MLTPEEKSDLSYKQLNASKVSTNTRLLPFEESNTSDLIVFPENIWKNAGDIPTSGPTGYNPLYPTGTGATTGTSYEYTGSPGDWVIKKWVYHPLAYEIGSNYAFRNTSEPVRNIIDFNRFGNEYEVSLYYKDGATFIEIPFGLGNWTINHYAGVVTFYDDIPEGVGTEGVLGDLYITAYTYEGPFGVAGSAGAQGPTGPAGGPTGDTGAAGSQGPQGNQGNVGPVGPPGSAGSGGVQGLQGSQGLNGSQGGVGFQGLQGSIGVRGYQGLQGEAGPQGLQGFGLQGNQGVQGLQGLQGNQGRQGSLGPTGPAGDASSFTGPQGNQGRQGVQGAQGAQGNQGNQGVQGTQGTQGSQGAQGRQGPQGTQGTEGNQGSQGAQGAQGSQGPQGTQGNQGPQGTQGNQGAQGAQGSQGPQGTQGNQGPQGAQGNQGPQGTQGNRGLQGPQGVEGPTGTCPCPTRPNYQAVGPVSISGSTTYTLDSNNANEVLFYGASSSGYTVNYNLSSNPPSGEAYVYTIANVGGNSFTVTVNSGSSTTLAANRTLVIYESSTSMFSLLTS